MRTPLLVLLTCAGVWAQDLKVLRAPIQPEPAEMVRSYLSGLAREQLNARRQGVSGIRTAAALNERRAAVRQKFLRMIGGLPAQRTPLQMKITGTLQRDGYRVDKLVYQSQPNFYVTANLYVPTTGTAPYPAVLQPTGHSLAAKNRAFYQTLALGLVKQGFVVLTYDPLGQGERRVFYDTALGDSKAGSTTVEHEMLGVQNLLAGESVARYMIWDAMRSIDLLAAQPFVDPKRIGVAGCSGGGTLTVYIAALDERVAAAAPACYVTTWGEQLKGTGPQDAEQQFPDLLREGLDQADLVALAAPKPYLICSTTEDFFPVEGARQTFEEAKRMWGILGASDRIQWFSTGGGHGMPVPTREAIYGWMNRWLRGGPPGALKEPPFETEPEEALNATETGQVSTSLGGETASTLNARRLGVLKADPGDIRDRVLRLTRYEKPAGPVRSETFGIIGRDGYQVERLLYWTAGDRYVPALLFRPVTGNGKAVVMTDARGKAAEAGAEGDAAALARKGYVVLSIDLEGSGETTPAWGGYSSQWFGEAKVAWLGLMVGRPLIGLHMEDISRALDLLAERNLGAAGIAGFAKGGAGVDMAHAAVADTRLQTIFIEGGLGSYRSVVEAPLHRFMHGAVLPDVLRNYDLPDLMAALSPRKAIVISPLDPMGRNLPMAVARKLYDRHATVIFRRENDTIEKLGF